MAVDIAKLMEVMSAKDYQPAALSGLARRLGLPREETAELERLLVELESAGVVVHRRARSWALPARKRFLLGRLTSLGRRFATVEVENQAPPLRVRVPVSGLAGALPGDGVLAEVVSRRQRRRQFPTARGRGELLDGRIALVIERARKTLVGRFSGSGRFGYLQPMSEHAPEVPITVPEASAPKSGQVIVASFPPAPLSAKARPAVLEQVLGDFDAPGVDAQCIIREFDLREAFPEAVLQAAARVAKPLSGASIHGRLDLTDSLTITIDPEDAADFDDAISVARGEDGSWRLGVHIADVAHYVHAGGPLDQEASGRGFSVYLPGRVLPMLPPALSSEMASLKEKETRLTKSVLMELDAQGKLKSSRIAGSVIRSSKRLTYEQAEEMLGSAAGHRGTMEALRKLVQDGWELARRLSARRLASGAIDLDMPEPELRLNELGEAQAVKLSGRLRSHRIIEEFMLLANEVVAKFFLHHKLPLISRSHPRPDPAALTVLFDLVRELGLRVGHGNERKMLQSILNQVRGKQLEYVVNLAVLRAMEQARYSPEAREHFGLALAHYCHFTSPIRRYPDLVVHQVLDAHLAGGLANSSIKDWRSRISGVAAACTEQERKAESAERELVTVKTLKLLERRGRREYIGTVLNLVPRGLFVKLDDYWVEGFLPRSGLTDDRYRLAHHRTALLGRRTGKRIRLGTKLRVGVAQVDPFRGQLLLRLAT